MDPPVSRREQDNRHPVDQEEKAENLLPALENLSITNGTLGTETGHDGKSDVNKKPKRTFGDLRPVVQELLNECFSKLSMVPTDLDPSIYDSLLDFPDPIQYEIVASFCRADLTSIRNKTGYFIGILKQYRKNGKAMASSGTAFPQVPAYSPLPFQINQPTLLYPPLGTFFNPSYNAFLPYNYGLLQALTSQMTASGKGLAALPLSIQIKFRTMFANGDVKEGELDNSIYDSLQDFDEFTQAAILDRFASTKFSKVRNKTGYFISLLKLARQARAADLGLVEAVPGSYFPPFSQYGDVYNPYGHNPFPSAPSYLLPGFQANFSPSFSKICPRAQARLAHLYNACLIRRTDLEDCVFDSLADFPEIEQLRLCEKFAGANLANVRNKTAFFIGILKRHRGQLQQAPQQQPT